MQIYIFNVNQIGQGAVLMLSSVKLLIQEIYQSIY
jgi:hypothetical protein